MKRVTFIFLLTILVLPFCKNRALAQQDTRIFPAKKHFLKVFWTESTSYTKTLEKMEWLFILGAKSE